eukprot:6838344-Prymnesium_polylepis.1
MRTTSDDSTGRPAACYCDAPGPPKRGLSAQAPHSPHSVRVHPAHLPQRAIFRFSPSILRKPCTEARQIFTSTVTCREAAGFPLGAKSTSFLARSTCCVLLPPGRLRS